MPDESCRICGGDLVTAKSCSCCRKSIQKKCKSCNIVAQLQHHQHSVSAVTSNQNPILAQTAPVSSSKGKRNSLHFSLVVGIIGFLILGLAATYSDMPQVVPDEAQATTNNEIKIITNLPISNAQSYGNCLAYGSGESVTVTCPTGNGTVYKGILNMPNDLSHDFADSVFSIRGVSVTENHDGSVILQYHMKKYVTNYFGN
jgi:hypothetical protein